MIPDSLIVRLALAVLIFALIFLIARLQRKPDDTIPNWRKRQYGKGEAKSGEADETDRPRYR